MGSPPIPDRSPSPDRAPPPKPAHIQWSPPKRRVGGSLKGKERAIESNASTVELEDITYRHLLGNGNGGPSNPLRCIAHIDIDAAYAAMEMARLGVDPATPLAVQQWNGLIAVNYPARAFGITRHETPADALVKCPHLVMVHCATYRQGDEQPGHWPDAKPETHKISLDHYRRESLKIIRLFSEHCPVVEKASIDESFLDVTLPVRAILLERYPFLATLPDSAFGNLDTPLPRPREMGVTIDWDKVGNVIPVHGEVIVEEKKEGEEVEVGESSRAAGTSEVDEQEERELLEEMDLTWADVALSIGAEIVAVCRTQVHEQLGYTCSAGIAKNKMLAKLCSAWKKPNAQTILRASAVPASLRPMRFQKIRNLGGKLGNAIKLAHDAETVGDLLGVSLREMQSSMGEESGMWVWEIIRGIDFSEVEAKTQVKSMLSSKNFKPGITKFGDASHWISILATELHLRLCEARENSPGLWPKTITFSHRPEYVYVMKSHQTAFPFTERLNIAYILRIAEKLLRTAVGEKLGPLNADTRIGPYGNMMLGLSGLEKLEEGQKGIERFFRGAAVGVKRGVKEEGGEGEAKRRKTSGEEEEEDDSTPHLPTFVCPRCSKVLSIPTTWIDSLRPGFAADAVEAALQREIDEHVDYHFARDMLELERKAQRNEVPAPRKGGTKTTSKGSSKTSAKPPLQKGQQSLAGFFGKRT